MMDDVTIGGIIAGLVQAEMALEDVLGKSIFFRSLPSGGFDENGVDILRAIVRHLLNTALGRDPTSAEMDALLARIEKDYRSGNF